MTVADGVTIGSLVLNVVIVALQSRIKADIATLRAETFEHFLSKADARYMFGHMRSDP